MLDKVKFFFVIFSFDILLPRRVGDFNPPPAQRRKGLWNLTEKDEQYDYGYMCECDDDEPCDCGWRKGKHRKWCAVLTPEQFDEFVEHVSLTAEDVETGGSIGAPGFGFGSAPAISFDGGRDDRNVVNVNAYVTPCPGQDEEFFDEETWQAIRRAVIDKYR